MMSLRLRSMVVVLCLAGTAIVGCAPEPRAITITVHYSGFDPAELTVPRGVPVTFTLVNEDPIDHEWLVGDAAFHEAHRAGTHEAHGELPTEVTIPALETVTTTVTFEEPGVYAYICHLPQHESYGMVGTLTVEG